MDQLRCFLDGDILCIVKNDFVNLQESDVFFLALAEPQRKIIDRMMIENRKQKPPKPLPVKSLIMDGPLQRPKKRRGHPDDLPDMTSSFKTNNDGGWFLNLLFLLVIVIFVVLVLQRLVLLRL